MKFKSLDNIWVYFRSILFISDSINELKNRNLNLFGFLAFILTVFALTIPDKKITLNIWMRNVLVVLVLFFIVLCMIFLFVYFVSGRKTYFVSYFTRINIILVLSLVLVSVPAFIVSHYVIANILGIISLRNFLFVLIPYYNFLIFGFATEVLSDAKGFRGSLIALVSMTVLFIFYNSLR